MKSVNNNNPVLKILCRRIQDALRFNFKSVAIPGLVMGISGIPTFREFYEPVLIAGGFKVRYVTVFRKKQTFVVLSWDKGLT